MKDIDEAIQYCEDVAQQQDMLKGRYDDASGYTRSGNEAIRTSDAKKCEKCAADHRQLASWLKDYKWLKEQEPCGDVISRKDTCTAIIKRLGIKDETFLLEAERAIYQQILAMPSAQPQEDTDDIATQYCESNDYVLVAKDVWRGMKSQPDIKQIRQDICKAIQQDIREVMDKDYISGLVPYKRCLNIIDKHIQKGESE